MDKANQEQIKNIEDAIKKEQAFIDECDEALHIFDHTASSSITALRAYISSVQPNKSGRMNFYLQGWDHNLETIQYLLNNMYREVSMVRNAAEKSLDSKLEWISELKEFEKEEPIYE